MRSLAVIVIGLLLAAVPASWAYADKTWTGASGSDWAIGGSWDPTGVPGSGDAVIINSGTVNHTTNDTVDSLMDNGNLYLTSGSLTVTASANIQSSGRVANSAVFNVGTDLSLDNGAQVSQDTGSLSVGRDLALNGASSLAVSGGAVTVGQDLVLAGVDNANQATVDLSGGSLTVGRLVVTGPSALNEAPGAVLVATNGIVAQHDGSLTIGDFATPLDINSGASSAPGVNGDITADASLNSASEYTTVAANATALSIGGNAKITGIGTNASLSLAANALANSGSVTASGGAAITMSGTTIDNRASGAVTASGAGGTLNMSTSDALTNEGTIAVSGGASMNLSAGTGPVVNNGLVHVGAGSSATFSSGTGVYGLLNNAPGAVISGAGTIANSNVDNESGTVMPGDDGPGVMTLDNSNYTQGDGGTTLFRAWGTTQQGESSYLDVSGGKVSLSPWSVLKMDFQGYIPQAGDVFDLIHFADFELVASSSTPVDPYNWVAWSEGALPSGMMSFAYNGSAWNISTSDYTLGLVQDGNTGLGWVQLDFLKSEFTPVPESPSAVLLLSGILPVAYIIRRRRACAA